MGNKAYLAIFDLDGTLFDTSEVNYLAYRDAAAKYGFTLPREDFLRSFVGRNYREFLPELGVPPEALEPIHREKKRLYPEHLKHSRANRQLLRLVGSLRGDWQTALVTTASRRNTMDILGAFGAAELFDLIIAQEDVARLKPDPECYLTAMERAGVGASDTLIFEDSDAGIAAAGSTGAAVVRVERF